MTAAPKNPKVDAILAKTGAWAQEMAALREIALSCPLHEEVKWGQACYTSQGKNIVLIHAFKDYCALLFMKGALMQDAQKLLVRQTENVQAGRQIRFTRLAQIEAQRADLKAYIEEAIAIERAGLKIEKASAADMEWPQELRTKLEESAKLAGAFAALTPGRRRAYLLHILAAKQAKIRAARIEACAPKILAGKGLDD